MGLVAEVASPPNNGELSPAWVVSALGVSLENAEWLLVLYRFASPGAFGGGESSPRRIYFCEPL